MARLMVSLLGPFQVLLDGLAIRGLHSAPLRGLLSFLVVESEREHTRRHLADLLWPEQPDQVASSNLRYTLSDLRYAIGDLIRDTPGRARNHSPSPFLQVTRETLRLNPQADCWVDVREFEWLSTALHHRGDPQGECERLEAAAGLYRGPLLEGFAYPASSLFEDWLFWNREQYQRRMIELLRRLVVCYHAAGRYEAAQSAARRQVQLEPLDEEAHRQLMVALARCGQRNAALAHYQQWHATLRSELRVEPSRETITLYETIRADALPPVAPALQKQWSAAKSFVGQTPDREVQTRPEAYDATGVHGPPTLPARASRFVARQDELTRLNQHLVEMLQGHGRVVFVTGDAGSGKTALMREFLRRGLDAHPDLVVVGGSCNAATGIGDPYLPFREIMQLLTGDIEAHRAGGAIGPELARRLWFLLPHVVQALVDLGPGLIDHFVPSAGLLMRADSVLLGHTDHTPWRKQLVELSRGQSNSTARERMDVSEQVARVLCEVSYHAPLILALDDLQWLDNPSADLLFHLGRHLEGRRILVLAAYRSPDLVLGRGNARHPLLTVINELQRDFGHAEIDLDETEGRAFLDAYIDREQNRFSASFRDTLYAHTGGHALFTVESLRGLQERGDIVKDTTGAWIEGANLDWSLVPPRVEAVIAERIGRLPAEAQALLTAASVEGEEFTAEVAAQVTGIGRTDTLQLLSKMLGTQHRLVHAHRVVWLEDGKTSISRYRFQHALFQEYLYQQLDLVARVRLHELTAAALEQMYASHTADVAVQLAHHFELAGQASRAADYWLEAGQQAMRLFAYREAQADFKRALELLGSLQQTPGRAQRQLHTRLAHAWASTMLGGWSDPERAAAATSALSLGEQAGGLTNIVHALLLQADVHASQGDFVRSREVGQRMLSIAEASGDRQANMLANYSLGVTASFAAEVHLARRCLETALDLYREDEDGHVWRETLGDIKAQSLGWLSFVLWSLGYPEQAGHQVSEAIERARLVDQTLMLGTFLGARIFTAVLERVPRGIDEWITHLDHLVDDRKLEPLRALRDSGHGWLLVRQGLVTEGLTKMMAAAESYRRKFTPVGTPWQLAAIALTALEAGRSEEGLGAIEQSGPLLQTGIGRLVEGELQRLRGELLLQIHDRETLDPAAGVDAMAEVETSFRAALEIAKARDVRMFELRAATSLARLWQRQGRLIEAGQLLEAIYVWFTEGFELPDLRDARKLLDQIQLQTGRLPL